MNNLFVITLLVKVANFQKLQLTNKRAVGIIYLRKQKCISFPKAGDESQLFLCFTLHMTESNFQESVINVVLFF